MSVENDETTNNARLTSDVLPEVLAGNSSKDSDTGVSTSYVPTQNLPSSKTSALSSQQSWFVLRATYGREKNAFEYLTQKNIKAFYPTIITKKIIKEKLRKAEESMLPNILFAYSTFDELKKYVYDNVHDETKHLRFYYDQHHDGTKEPLIVPEKQMKSLMIICGTDSDNVIFQAEEVDKFKEGQRVVVMEGDFKGVEGIVARYHGQQRVGVVIKGLLTATTAYIPSAFLKKHD